jgi:hypothetical protein
MMGRSGKACAAALFTWAILGPSAVPAHAQDVLDWTVRGNAAPEALARGAAAVFWNPGSIALDTGRLEAFVLDLEGPSMTGLSGVAVAAAGSLPRGTLVGLGYQHLAVGGIPVTDESPTSGAGTEITVAEDRFTLSGAQAIGASSSAGAVIQYERSANGSETDNHVTFGAGFSYRGSMRLRPAFGAAAFVGAQTRWIAGVQATPPLALPATFSVQVAYGISGGERQSTPSHRASLTGEWRHRLALTAALSGEPGADGLTLQPVLGAELRLGRYLLGVLREGMPNGFGATYSYRLNVRL